MPQGQGQGQGQLIRKCAEFSKVINLIIPAFFTLYLLIVIFDARVVKKQPWEEAMPFVYILIFVIFLIIITIILYAKFPTFMCFLFIFNVVFYITSFVLAYKNKK